MALSLARTPNPDARRRPGRPRAQTQVIINCGALPCLLNLLQTSHKKSIKKEACWTISNITAGTKDQIQAVIDNHILPPLVQLLSTAEFDIKKESAWAISNATSGGTADQIKYLVHAGCVRPLCDLLTCADVRIVTVALEGLENILKVPPARVHPYISGALGAPRDGCRAWRASAASAHPRWVLPAAAQRQRLPLGRSQSGGRAARLLPSARHGASRQAARRFRVHPACAACHAASLCGAAGRNV